MKRLFDGNIYLNGKFHEAVVIEDGAVIALDDQAQKFELAPEKVAFLTHSFKDAHVHPILAGRDLIGLNVSDCTSVAEIQERVSNWLKTHPGDDLVVGGTYDRNLTADGEFLSSWLDEVSGDRPVALHATDHHTLWVNTAALGLIGPEDRATTGIDERGLLLESAAKDLVLRHSPASDDEAAFLAAQEVLLELGITQITDAWVNEDLFATYEVLARTDVLKLDVELTLAVEPNTWRENLEFFSRRIDHPRVSVTGAKFFVDGVFGGATAAVHEPYETTQETGQLMWQADQLIEALKDVSSLGLLPHLHAIGDRAVDYAIDALEAANCAAGATIVHLELATDEALAKLAQLGIIANIQPLWGRRDAMLQSCSRHLGTRVESLYRTLDAIDSGVKIVFGSDWPVSSPDPILGIHTAVTRRVAPQDEPLGANQAIGVYRAFDAYASHNGYVILSANPNASNIRTLRVVETL